MARLAAGGETVARELTREEKATIRKLVTRLCANYDRDVGCLPLDCPCYMLEKCWTGALCRYFREAVLPNDPVLEASLAAEGPARMRQGLSPGWPDTVLLPRLRQGRKAQKAAGLYAEIPGVMR